MRDLALFVTFFGLLVFVLKNTFAGILMWFWISLMNPHMFVYGFASGINYAMIVALVTFASWLLHPEEQKIPPNDRITFLLIAMMVWILITSLTGAGLPEDVYAHWIMAEKMLLMTVVAYAMTNTRVRFDQLVLVCVLSIAFYGLRGGVFTLLHGGAFRVYGPSGTMIGDNNDLGVALTMMLPMLFYLRHRYNQPYLKWPMRGLIALTIIGDLFTYSRGAFLALCAMFIVLWLRTQQKIATGTVIVVAVVGMLFFAPQEWLGRMKTIESYETDGSATGRLYYWQLGWAVALRHPIVGAGTHWSWNPDWVNRELAGSGLPSLTIKRSMHSIWFEMLSDHGFVGLALFIGFFIVTAANAQWLIRRARGNSDLAWANSFGRMLQVALVGFGAGGSFVTLGMYDGFYALVIMGAAARRIVAAELANQERMLRSPFGGTAPAAATLRPDRSFVRLRH